MRGKVVIIISLIVIGLFILLGYMAYGNRNEYIEEFLGTDEQLYKTEIDEHKFYADEITDNEAVNVSNILSLMGETEEAVIVEEHLSEEGDDFNRDIIRMYCDDIDYNENAYSAYVGSDIYYVWTDTSGNIRGLHMDENYNLIELR